MTIPQARREAAVTLPASRAALSALLGSSVEYYDFTLFATASALVLGPVFFAPTGSLQPTLSALVTFGLAFVARPFGAVLFGHVGDRLGRRAALVGSVLVMGVATTAIGLLPGTADWGLAAPFTLLVLRLVQGLSAGGEQAGSNALTVEHAPAGRRGLLASWTMQGTTLGTLAGKLAFIGVLGLPQPALLAWGWRVPFLIAGPLLLVTWWIRRRVVEPEAFVRAPRERLPVRSVLARHPREVALVAVGTSYAVGGAALNVYGLSFATDRKLITANSYLWVLVAATLVGLAVQPLWARLSDRRGRRPLFVTACLATALAFFAFFSALGSGNLWLFGLAAGVLSLAWSGANAVSAAYFSELFPTPVRHTGAALGGQLGMVLAGFAPAIMAGLAAPGPGGWVGPATFGAGCLIAAALAALLMGETSDRPLDPDRP